MNDKKRKNKAYYISQAKKAKYERFEKSKLRPGLRGFLCTTNNKERECVREAYNLLNEFANDMYGPEIQNEESSTSADVEDSLEEELAALKKEKQSKVRRFQQCESGAKNCIFINTQLEQTSPLVERIAEEIQKTKQQRTRYLMRMLPVQVTCKATEEDIRKSSEQMIKDAFNEIGITYTTIFKSRNQEQLTQSSAQNAVNELIEAVCPTARLDHKTPQLTICMDVIKNVMCLGIVKDYFQRRKYNLVELAKPDPESPPKADGKPGDEEADTDAEAKQSTKEDTKQEGDSSTEADVPKDGEDVEKKNGETSDGDTVSKTIDESGDGIVDSADVKCQAEGIEADQGATNPEDGERIAEQ